jgi:hypothetical protein
VLDSSGKEGKTCLAVHLEKREDAAHLLTQSGPPIKSNQINQPTNQSAISLPTRQPNNQATIKPCMANATEHMEEISWPLQVAMQ